MADDPDSNDPSDATPDREAGLDHVDVPARNHEDDLDGLDDGDGLRRLLGSTVDAEGTDDVDELKAALAAANEDVATLLRRLHDTPRRVRTLEERLLETKGRLAQAVGQNEKLTFTLREAREHIRALRDEVDKLTQPPAAHATLVGHNDDGTVDVVSSGRKMRVEVSPSIELDQLVRGAEVVLNESFAVVGARAAERSGEIVTVKELLEPDDSTDPDAAPRRAVVVGRADEERVVAFADTLADRTIRSGDLLLIDPRSAMAIERLPPSDVDTLLLEEVPDIDYDDIGGLDEQIEQITDAVELPFLHQELFGTYQLPAPKGILLYGPPGCGKTLIAKAVANSLAKKVTAMTGRESRSYFISIKGPELLNKYVGETERHIRDVFQRARDKAADGTPVIIFFDEMESLFRTRGTGISSDMESTIVPQLLAEIDGVETLRNVIVIGASNREDLIDPAILRPGRLDVKIKINRPDAEAAAQVFGRYLTTEVPIDAAEVESLGGGETAKAVRRLIEDAVELMYRDDEANQFLEVTYQHGDKEVMYFKDFASGAMIENIVRRSKKLAIKRELEGGGRGIRSEDLATSIRQEFKEHEDLPNTTNPDDWAKISGKKGERIVYIRTLVHTVDEGPEGGRTIEAVATGQYL
ncbi:MAG: proteasome ATPase [Microthrixaceae bacterium]